MPATLEITDGTTTVDLIHTGGGAFYLSSWRPAIAQMKGGGVFMDSSLADGRRIIDRHYGNVIETFNLKVRGTGQDSLARELQTLRGLLEKAVNYWVSDWQNEPVWLVAQAECETQPRYAILYSWSTPEDENPFAQPFLQADGAAVVDEWTLTVERGDWLEQAPGTATVIETGHTVSYGGRTLGRAATTADEVYIANKHNVANITHIYAYDDSLTTFSANLMDAALPFDLFPNPPGEGDILYIGCDASLTDSGPFCSLVFDIGTAQSGIDTAWEYWNGAAWDSLNPQDNTSGDGESTLAGQAFDTAGVKSVHWEQENDWAANTINAVNAFWVRCRITGPPVAPTVPTQQNRDVYTATWGYAEIASDQTGGDLPAFARTTYYNQSGQTNLHLTYACRTIYGLRTYDRGADFRAYLNASDEQNVSGLTVTASGGTAAFADRSSAPTGRALRWSPAVATSNDILYYTFSSNLIQHFYGTYRAFLRVEQGIGAAGEIGFKLLLAYSDAVAQVYETDYVYNNLLNYIELLDIGEFDIFPLTVDSNEPIEDVQIVVVATTTNNAPVQQHWIYDLILIPADEFIGDFMPVRTPGTSELTYIYGLLGSYRNGITIGDTGTRLVVDSIERPKVTTRAYAERVSSGDVSGIWRPIAPGRAVLQNGTRQRAWFLFETGESYTSGSDQLVRWYSDPAISGRVQFYRQNRYFSYRGDQ